MDDKEETDECLLLKFPSKSKRSVEFKLKIEFVICGFYTKLRNSFRNCLISYFVT